MTSAREVVARVIADVDRDDAAVDVDYYPWVADAVLDALREHWTSDETRLRVVDGMAESSATQDEWWANVIAALFEEDQQ